jgi:predicted MFS family arabinose efflux permease
MCLACVLATITLSGVVRPWHVFVLASMLGLVNAFDIPARQSFIVEMVGKEDLMHAIALNSSLVNGARIAGPALAGVLVAAVGEGFCFALNAVSFLAVICGLLLMRDLPPPKPRQPGTVLEGFRFAARTPEIRSVLLLLGLVSLTAMPYTILMPVMADRVLHGGPRTLGALMGSAGSGALIGTIAITLFAKPEKLHRWIPAASILFGAGLIAFSRSQWLPLSMVLLVPTGTGMMMQMSTSNTLLQTRAPDAMRGRVMALFAMMFMGSTPFGALLAGFLAKRIGAPLTLTCGGSVCIAGAIAFLLGRKVISSNA